MNTTISPSRDLAAEVHANAARLREQHEAEDQAREQAADTLRKASVAGVLARAADILRSGYTAARITAPFVTGAILQAVRELEPSARHESELLECALDALEARLPASFLGRWAVPLATAEVLQAFVEAERAERIILAKQQLGAPGPCPELAPADPAEVYADAEYRDEQADRDEVAV